MKNKSLLFLAATILSLFIFSQEMQAQCHPDDYTALRALYTATDGDNWTDNTGWDVSASSPAADCDVCNWHGIVCEDGRVTEIRLGENNLVGLIPIELSNLTNLKIQNFNL